MKVTAECYPTERLPREVWRAIRNAWTTLAGQWGVAVDIEEALSIQEAERRCDEDPPRDGRG